MSNSFLNLSFVVLKTINDFTSKVKPSLSPKEIIDILSQDEKSKLLGVIKRGSISGTISRLRRDGKLVKVLDEKDSKVKYQITSSGVSDVESKVDTLKDYICT